MNMFTRMIATAWIGVIIVVLCGGCITLFGGERHKFKFPGDIRDMCYAARTDARAAIQAKGTKLSTKSGCKVIKVPGIRKIAGKWAWERPEYPGHWIAGLCTGPEIQVGCHPHTGGEVNNGTLTHEFGHHWLITNYSNYTHDPRYDRQFENWAGSRGRSGRTIMGLPGPDLSIRLRAAIEATDHGMFVTLRTVDDAGRTLVIDFIVPGPNDLTMEVDPDAR